MGCAVGSAEAVSRFAQSLIQYDLDECGRKSRKELLSDMFDGNVRLLEDSVSLKEMFRAFDEEYAERNKAKIISSISEGIRDARGRKKVFW